MIRWHHRAVLLRAYIKSKLDAPVFYEKITLATGKSSIRGVLNTTRAQTVCGVPSWLAQAHAVE
jgi:hypothetical protein